MATICPFINICKKRAGFAALVTLIAAAPAWARVDITVTQVGETNEFIISYEAIGEPNLIRAFALDIRLDNDTNIVEVTAINPDYYIFPGNIQIDAQGKVTDFGTAVAEYSDLPSDTLPGLDSNGITIELASLYAPVGLGSPNAPPMSGDLLSLKVSGSFYCITISGNIARAGVTGVVMEDPDQIVEVNFPICVEYPCIGCYCDQPDYYEWVRFNEPDCWCYPRQCHGDADGLKEGNVKAGFWYCGLQDLNILVSAWKILEPATEPTPSGPGIGSVPRGICADFDHLAEGNIKAGFWRVGLNDLNILVNCWKVLQSAEPPTPSGPGIPPDCLN